MHINFNLRLSYERLSYESFFIPSANIDLNTYWPSFICAWHSPTTMPSKLLKYLFNLRLHPHLLLIGENFYFQSHGKDWLLSHEEMEKIQFCTHKQICDIKASMYTADRAVFKYLCVLRLFSISFLLFSRITE